MAMSLRREKHELHRCSYTVHLSAQRTTLVAAGIANAERSGIMPVHIMMMWTSLGINKLFRT